MLPLKIRASETSSVLLLTQKWCLQTEENINLLYLLNQYIILKQSFFYLHQQYDEQKSIVDGYRPKSCLWLKSNDERSDEYDSRFSQYSSWRWTKYFVWSIRQVHPFLRKNHNCSYKQLCIHISRLQSFLYFLYIVVGATSSTLVFYSFIKMYCFTYTYLHVFIFYSLLCRIRPYDEHDSQHEVLWIKNLFTSKILQIVFVLILLF